MKKTNEKRKLRLILLMMGLVALLIVGLVACKENPSTPIDTLHTEEAPTDLLTDAPSEPEASVDSEPVDVPTDEPADSNEDPAVSGDAQESTESSDNNGDGVITRPPVITLPPLNPGGSETAEPEETLPYDPSLHPGNADDYHGVMISAVYGTGKKNTDAAMESGFVQLYNRSMYTVSLKGASLYYKSDGASPFDQFVFPEDATIAPGGYYLVKCESVANYDESMAVIGMEHYDAEWDTTFDNHEIRLLLAPSGWAIGRDEDILLFDDAISVFVATESYNESVYAVDGMSKNKIAVRTALKEYSGYHTVNLAERATGELQKAAPIASGNRVNPVIAPRINEVTFSQPAGVYDKAFNLSLTAKDGYKIYYTTDGSDPKVSGKQYTGAITLKDSSAMTWGPTIKAGNRYIGSPASSTLPGGYVIKAYATNGTESTPVYTNTYFVIPDLCDYGVTVMSISMPVEEIFGNEGFYNEYMLIPGNITSGRRRGTAIMEVFDTDGDRVGNSTVELAVSGNGSSGLPMKSLRIYYKGLLNEDGGREGNLDYDLFEGRAKDQHGQVITTFDRLLLRNSGNDCGHSYIRDAYMQRISESTSVGTMASASTLVFINGEFWGVYNIRERYSPEYVESHYGVDKENVAVIESDYSQVHSDHMADYIVSSGIEGDADSFNAMTAYMRSHNLADPEAYAYVCSQMDIDSFIDMWVIRLFFNARDWPENNMKVWRNRNPEDPSGFDTKWHFTLLDMDMGLSYFPRNDGNNTSENANFFGFIHSGSVCGRMMRDLLNNPGFREQFMLRYYELVNDHFTADYMSAEFEAMVAERDPLMPLQVKRWSYAIGTWNSDVSDIRSFIQNRTSYALTFFFNHFGTSAEEMENMSYRRVTVSYNPDRVTVYINGEPVSNGTQFRFEDKEREFQVSVTVKEGYTLNGIVWAPNSGTTQREDNATETTFKVTTSGTISVYAKRDKTGPTDTAGQIIAGPTYMFYLTGTGELYAWGDNRNGVLALGSSSGTIATPSFVMSNVAKVDTTQGAAYENSDMVWMTAILTKDGKLYTVGSNTCGQLGRNGTNDDSRLDLVPFNGKIVDVSVGYDHMLIIDDKGVMWGIGSNSNGQMGAHNQGGTTQTFVKIAENVAMISAGRRSTVYVDDNGKMYGLGDNRWKKLSQNHGDIITTPILMMENVKYVGSGEHQIVVVTENGDLYYAGWREFNSFNQGGGNNPTLRKVMSGVEKADIYHSNMVILTENGDAYVYGFNQDGGIGSSAVTGGTPQKIYSSVLDVTAGYGFTAFFCDDGTIRVLGDNTYGQGGTGQAGGRVDFSDADV